MNRPILRRKVSEGNFQEHIVEGPTCTVGRSRECDITINDTSLSRLHMRLEERDGSWFVVDNNSSNGTFLNRRKITEAPLIHGDIVITGRVQFTFVNELITAGSVTKPMPTINSVQATVSADIDALNSIDPYDSVEGGEAAETLDPSEPAFPPVHGFGGNESVVPSPPPLNQVEPEPAPVVPAQHPKPQVRVLALIIDVAVGIGLTLPGMIVSVVLNMGLIGFVLQLLGAVAAIAHFLVGWLKYGKTAGKHVLGLRISMLDSPQQTGLEPKVAVLRLMGGLVGAATCGLLFLTVLFDPDGRGFHDKISGTKVVRGN